MKRRLGNRRKVRQQAQLRMTSMMDILTVLLLFLLKSFVVEGEVITPAAGVELPKSSSEVTPEESLVIAIDETRISLGNEFVADLAQGPDDMLITPLYDRLDAALTQMEQLEERRGRQDTQMDRITIQGDKDMPFHILQKVMFTCNQSGFAEIQLAVLKSS